MMETVDFYRSSFQAREALSKRREPRWLIEQRRSAFEQFAARGFPSAEDEEWRGTSVKPILQVPFAGPGESDGDPAIAASAASALTALGGAIRVVLLNGRFSPERSSLSGLPRGARVLGLAEALSGKTLAGGAAQLERGLAAPALRGAFAALNGALWSDGALIFLPRGAALARPLEIVYSTGAGDRPFAVHPRSLVIADEDSSATLVERFVGEGCYLANATTRIEIGQRARIDHHLLVEEGRQAFHVGELCVRQAEGSHFHSHVLSIGAALARNEIEVELAGEGSSCLLDGLSLASGKQHVDNHTRIEHAAPQCRSEELYKGILSGSSRSVFTGRIVVRPGAQKTDARQTHKSLLLSDEAGVSAKPQLEIRADDVKCSHGAAVGQLDKDALFYLRSRGLGEAEARSLLTQAFANEVLGRIGWEPLRAWAAQRLEGWLKGA
jgi:Fe-S cluster assembly protein SufD